DPAYQRRGYGALLLWDAAEYMAREGYPLSLIPGEGVERFYERGGWRNFHHYYKRSFRLPTTFPGLAFQGEVRPAHLEHDLDGILSIFAENHLDVSGPAVRTRGFWLVYARDWE